MADNSKLNGINKDELHGAVDAVKADPSLANFKFRATNTWHDGFHAETKIKDFIDPSDQVVKHKTTFSLHADEPPALLGQDAGANATEALLHALASCMGATLIFHATLKGIKIDDMQLELVGDIDVNGFMGTSQKERNGFKGINVNCKIKADVSDEELQHLCELAQQHSPVFDIVTHPVPVKVTANRA